MRISILSDIHDNIPKLRNALDLAQDTDVLLCLGDLCSPFIVKELAEGFEGPIHIVFGNNDGDRYRITDAASRYNHVDVLGEYAEFDFDGVSFAINHFDNIGNAIARAESYDVVCFGHNHHFEITEHGRSLIVNPGEIYGMLTGASSFVIYDTSDKTATRIDVV